MSLNGGFRLFSEYHTRLRNTGENNSDLIIVTVHVDNLTLSSARKSAGMVMTKLQYHIQMGYAFHGLEQPSLL